MNVMPLPVDDGGPSESSRWSPARRLVVAFVALLVVGGGVWAAAHIARTRDAAAVASHGRGLARGPDPTRDSLARAPAGVRVKVQVVNATRVRGLARRATQVLRDRGYDVVEVGTTGQLRDTSLVLVRSGHADWGARLARAIGGASVESRPDSSHYLDLTVLVGRVWHPPAEPFYP